MWQRDPFKAKWTIVARAYSSIRDKVGKNRAQLDRFLTLVCPELGIIDAADYLEMMLWVFEIGANGVMMLEQVAVPDIDSFEDHIKHTIMTEKDVIHFCAQESYITHATAIAIAGPQAVGQQGLLATAPVVPATTPAAAANNQFLNNTNANLFAATNQAINQIIGQPINPPANQGQFLYNVLTQPRHAASQVLGFDVDELLDPATQPETSNLPPSFSPEAPAPAAPPSPPPYQWTGCMADLYNPHEGTYDFASVGNTNNDAENEFDTGEISDPLSFDAIFGPSIQDGFVHPSSKFAHPPRQRKGKITTPS